jgi:hypothetical protein
LLFFSGCLLANECRFTVVDSQQLSVSWSFTRIVLNVEIRFGSREHSIDYYFGRSLAARLAALGLRQVSGNAETAVYNGGSKGATTGRKRSPNFAMM